MDSPEFAPVNRNHKERPQEASTGSVEEPRRCHAETIGKHSDLQQSRVSLA